MMLNRRSANKKAFVRDYFGKKLLSFAPLQSDASLRKYERITDQDKTYILMDSPTEHYKLSDFIDIARFLNNHGFSVPYIYNIDTDNGFLLLEDFGTTSIGQYIARNNDINIHKKTYKLAIDLLVKINSITEKPNIPYHDKSVLLNNLKIYADWYIPFSTGKNLSHEKATEFITLWSEVLDKNDLMMRDCVVLRDYHVENMMSLDRSGINSIGLLDFQDANLGSPLYDLASLLQDARIEVNSELAIECFNYYIQQTTLDYKAALSAYNILSAQRTSRILGLFARMSMRDQNTQYLQYIPRVLSYLERNLSHESLKPIAEWMKSIQ